MDKVIELMNDSFGNYLIQKVLENLNDQRLKEMLITVKTTVLIRLLLIFLDLDLILMEQEYYRN